MRQGMGGVNGWTAATKQSESPLDSQQHSSYALTHPNDQHQSSHFQRTTRRISHYNEHHCPHVLAACSLPTLRSGYAVYGQCLSA